MITLLYCTLKKMTSKFKIYSIFVLILKNYVNYVMNKTNKPNKLLLLNIIHIYEQIYKVSRGGDYNIFFQSDTTDNNFSLE